MAYRGDKKAEDIFPPGHPFLQPRIVFGMKPPPSGSSESKPGASSGVPLDPNESYTPDHPRYAEAVAQNPMLPAQNGLEEWLQREAAKYGATEQPPQAQSASKASTSPENPDKL